MRFLCVKMMSTALLTLTSDVNPEFIHEEMKTYKQNEANGH